jgi:pyruvate kinase
MDRSRTKLVCTIGPASAERIGELVAAGMDVARINFSHGSPEDHKAYVHAVRAAAHSARRSVAVMADLPGPKIRLGQLTNGAVTLQTGSTFTLRPRHEEPAPAPQQTTADATDAAAATGPSTEMTAGMATGATDDLAATTDSAATDASVATGETEAPDATDDTPATEQAADSTSHNATDTTSETATETSSAEAPAQPTEQEANATADQPGDASGATVSTSGLAAQLQVGDRILLADGAAELRVTAIDGTNVTTEVVNGGVIRTRSGVNIPSARLTGDGLTAEDRASIPRALELRVDLIAQSFVRSADDVKALRALLPADGPRVVAKIETRAAVDAFDDILLVADGIMVARGDLGVDLPFEDVPLVQKDLVGRATRAGRFSIVATQMLESMTAAPRPTRAEVSDVANAVLDGSDGVMLSAETAIGQFPLEALQAMARICSKTEADGGTLMRPTEGSAENAPADSIIAAATHVASRVGTRGSTAIWCFTRSGRTAELLSIQRPETPIVAFTLNPIVARRLAVRSGVMPMVLSAAGGRGESLLERMETAWRAQRNRTDYDNVVLVTTSRNPAGINRVEVHSIGSKPSAPD